MQKFIRILGGGESGTGAALLAKKMGYDVLLSDAGILKDVYKSKLILSNVMIEEEGHAKVFDSFSEEVVISPGISLTSPVAEKLRREGAKLISEIEFASRFSQSYIIAVTGSNGKTTTVEMIEKIFKDAGEDVLLAGNVGNSWASALLTHDAAVTVLELSSFQLDTCYDFHPNVSIITSLSPDHLDRYEDDLEKYTDSKFRVTLNQTQEDAFIYNHESKTLVEAFNRRVINARPFALNHASAEKLTQDFFAACNFRGRHNEWNARAAAIAASLSGIDFATIKSALSSFTPPAHRMEFIAEIDGVAFVNDSKATNVDATFYALDGLTQPCVWIAGGQDKGNDYAQLLPVLSKVKALICLGLDNAKLINFFTGKVPLVFDFQRIEDAFNKSIEISLPGDMVMLSPACASFDLFRNYIDRGNQFSALVMNERKKKRIDA